MTHGGPRCPGATRSFATCPEACSGGGYCSYTYASTYTRSTVTGGYAWRHTGRGNAYTDSAGTVTTVCRHTVGA